MHLRIQFFVILSSLALIVVILNLIRKGRLREEYSLIWLLCASIVFVLAVFRGSLQLVADWLGVDYGPSVIFMIGLGLIAMIQLLQTIAISKLTVQNRDLAQMLAILRWQVRELSRASELENAGMMAAQVEPEVEAEREPVFIEREPAVPQPADSIREDC